MTRPLFVLIGALAMVQLGCRPKAERIGPAEFYWLMNRACWAGDEIAVQMLLKAGADPNGFRDYEAFHRSEYQGGFEPSWPVNTATYGRHAKVVSMLLKAGAKADAPEDEGQTALTVAAASGHLEIARLLLEAGADRNIRRPDGRGFEGTAEEVARHYGHTDVAEAIRRFPLK